MEHGYRLGLIACVALAALVTAAPRASAATVEDLVLLYENGCLEQVLSLGGQLEAQAEVPPLVRYLRGKAALRLGQYEVARDELLPLGFASPGPGWPSPADDIRQLTEILRLLPPHVETVTFADHVVAKVAFSEETGPTRYLITHLPEGWHRACQLTGFTPGPTVILVLDTDKDPGYAGQVSQAFLGDWSGGTTRAYNLAHDAVGVMLDASVTLASLRSGLGREPTPLELSWDTYQTSLHELAHVFLARQLPKAHVPGWFNEGFASYSSRITAPFEMDWQPFERGLGSGWVQSLRREEGAWSYDALMTWESNPARPNAYAHSLLLFLALVDRIGGHEEMPRLLRLFRAHGDVDKALQVGWHVSVRELYDGSVGATVPGTSKDD